MTPKIMKTALFAAIAPVALSAVPASAQSITYAEPTRAIANAKALTAGYQQVDQTYASNIQSIQQKLNERQTVLQQLDTNGDNTVDDAELDRASQANVDKLNGIGSEINNLQQPILRGRTYVLQQLQAQYSAAQADVVKKNKITAILSPDAFIYLPDGANVTAKMTAALDARVPQAQITPPADWQPSRSTIALYSDVEDILQLDAYINAARQAQAQQQAQAAGQTAPAAPASSEQR